MQIDNLCPNCRTELTETYSGCHDNDPECECETIEACPKCGYQLFRTCANAIPLDIGEPHDGDMHSDGERPYLYDAEPGGWIRVPF